MRNAAPPPQRSSIKRLASRLTEAPGIQHLVAADKAARARSLSTVAVQREAAPVAVRPRAVSASFTRQHNQLERIVARHNTVAEHPSVLEDAAENGSWTALAAKAVLSLCLLGGLVWLFASGTLGRLFQLVKRFAILAREHPSLLAPVFALNAAFEVTLILSSVSHFLHYLLPVIFGFVVGPLLIFGLALTGSLSCFVSGRFVGRECALQAASKFRLFRACDRALQQDQTLVLVLRLSPLSDAVVSYVLALSGISFEQYLLGSLVEASKRTVQAAYIGFLLSLGLEHGNTLSQPGTLAIAAIGLIAILWGSVLLQRRISRELALLDEHGTDGVGSRPCGGIGGSTTLGAPLLNSDAKHPTGAITRPP